MIDFMGESAVVGLFGVAAQAGLHVLQFHMQIVNGCVDFAPGSPWRVRGGFEESPHFDGKRFFGRKKTIGTHGGTLDVLVVVAP